MGTIRLALKRDNLSLGRVFDGPLISRTSRDRYTNGKSGGSGSFKMSFDEKS